MITSMSLSQYQSESARIQNQNNKKCVSYCPKNYCAHRMRLLTGKKPENPAKTQTNTGRTCKLHRERAQSWWELNMGPSCCEATIVTTEHHCPYMSLIENRFLKILFCSLHNCPWLGAKQLKRQCGGSTPQCLGLTWLYS